MNPPSARSVPRGRTCPPELAGPARSYRCEMNDQAKDAGGAGTFRYARDRLREALFWFSEVSAAYGDDGDICWLAPDHEPFDWRSVAAIVFGEKPLPPGNWRQHLPPEYVMPMPWLKLVAATASAKDLLGPHLPEITRRCAETGRTAANVGGCFAPTFHAAAIMACEHLAADAVGPLYVAAIATHLRHVAVEAAKFLGAIHEKPDEAPGLVSLGVSRLLADCEIEAALSDTPIETGASATNKGLEYGADSADKIQNSEQSPNFSDAEQRLFLTLQTKKPGESDNKAAERHCGGDTARAKTLLSTMRRKLRDAKARTT